MRLRRLTVGALLKQALLLLFIVPMLYPFAYMFFSSFKNAAEIQSASFYLLPHQWVVGNYATIFEVLPFFRFYLNTVVITVARVVGQVLTSSLAAYAFARLRFPGRNAIFLGFLAVLMIPVQVTMIPTYVLIKYMGLLNTYSGLILPTLVSSFGIFLLRQFYLTMPKALEDAAVVDGCSPLSIYRRIALPIGQTAIVSFAILVILWSWNDFMWPLIIAQTTEMQTLSVAISYFTDPHMTYTRGVMMAGASLSVFPIVLVFISAQRYVVQGIAMGGLKF